MHTRHTSIHGPASSKCTLSEAECKRRMNPSSVIRRILCDLKCSPNSPPTQPARLAQAPFAWAPPGATWLPLRESVQKDRRYLSEQDGRLNRSSDTIRSRFKIVISLEMKLPNLPMSFQNKGMVRTTLSSQSPKYTVLSVQDCPPPEWGISSKVVLGIAGSPRYVDAVTGLLIKPYACGRRL
jgi:hypothetical protein